MTERKCRHCNGLGRYKCTACDGKGSKIVPNLMLIPVIGCAVPELVTCSICNGTGKCKCSFCDGTGIN